MKNRIVLALATAAFVLSLGAHAQSQTPTKIRYTLDWRYQGNLAEFMYAKTGGYFAKEGLDVTVDSGAGSTASITRLSSR